MKTSNLVTTAAFIAVLSFTAAQAEPEPGAMTPGGGAAGNIGAGGGGAMAPSTPGSSLDQPGKAAGPSDSMGAKDKAAGSPPSAGDAAKDPKGTAGAERDMSRD